MRRRLTLESLETRQVMAGNVIATVIAGELVIQGDNAANSIQVYDIPSSDGTSRTFRIIGRQFDGNFSSNGTPIATGAATTINGAPGPANFGTVADRVRILMRGGNDAVVFGGLANRTTTTTGLTIDTGAGSDYVRVDNVEDNDLNPVVIKTTLATGAAADLEIDVDTVVINRLEALRSMRLTTGGGNDRITINNFGVTNGETVINTGLGRDSVRITNAQFDRVLLDMGASVPSLRDVNSDRDIATVGNLEANSVKVFMGGGNDLIDLLSSIEVAGEARLHGGVDNDELRGSTNVIAVGTFVSVSIESTT